VTRRLAAFVLLAALVASAQPKHRAPDTTSEAARALFVRSDIEHARMLAQVALKRERNDVRALFIEMEAASLTADSPAALDAALRLCETRSADPRVEIAGARILDLAANTRVFRQSVPRVQKLVAAGSPQTRFLQAALLAAAMDGVPGLDPARLAHDAGILTEWRVNGPFGSRPNVDWEQRWDAETHPLAAAYDGRKSESFLFLDGNLNLPGYLRANDGVFFAESSVTLSRAGEMTLRLESPGTSEIFVDGESVLTKDDRLRDSADFQRVTLRLAAGAHRVTVKFLESALPWRVTLLPPLPPAKSRALPAIPQETHYLAAAERLWNGDPNGTLAELPAPVNVAEDMLAGQAWQHLATSADVADQHFRAALERSPLAFAAAYELAASDFAAGRVEDAANALAHIAAQRPYFVPATELLAEAADRLGWDKLAIWAFQHRFELHPSCDTILKAARLFAKSARYDKARAMEEEAGNCGPDSLAYAGALSERGEHDRAAQAAEQVVARYPLDRDALALLAEQQHLAGDDAAADNAARELARIAPDRAGSHDQATDFYTPYRRDGLALVRANASRRFSGGPIVALLNDRALRLNRDGSVDEYVHKLTRVLTKEGIEQYGEAAPPAGAELLELRTIKPDGRVFEPELQQHKVTISMPGLAPDDTIEIEYVLHRPSRDGLADYPDAFRYAFGSFTAPVLFARFVVETPADVRPRVLGSSNATLTTTTRGRYLVRSWEAENIAQTLQESAMTARLNLPTVEFLPSYHGWNDVRDTYRELLLESAHAGPTVEAAAAKLRGVANEEERARQVVAYAQKTVSRTAEDAFADGDLPAAEESLANGDGSRTVAVLALAQASGLDAQLLLARAAGEPQRPGVALATYTHPLVQFKFRKSDVVVDAEEPGLAFGALPPTIEEGQALAIPLHAPHGSALVALHLDGAREENAAEADLRLDARGDAEVRLEIRMGSWRSAQTRATLRDLSAGERRRFFEQVAQRIFPGAAEISGTAQHEADADQPLLLELRCRVARIVDLERLQREDALDIDQVVPTLGLKRMYAGSATRHFALLVDAPLYETATFRLHLPAEVNVSHNARSMKLETAFGSYAVDFRQPDARTLEIRRSFHIPVQVIEPVAYPAFAHFAQQIEDAERERIALARLGSDEPNSAAR
jgi:tetratricopeptide (TPR) repeat protein